jgi:hypothetical protein
VPILALAVRRYPRFVDDGVTSLLAQYGPVLADMHQSRIEEGGKPKHWNRLVDKMQTLHLQLADTADGRAAITQTALHGTTATERLWAATHALAWDAALVRPVLEAAAAADQTLDDLGAKYTLREFDAGRLNTGWSPKRV